ncbi:hypothetical protein [Desulfitibacter alkalitolerans]|uniref:hypothetical protein n=1 Tax=Desulfitibacter alkalitolerans TaxID=264641 RepID=UPI000486AA8A|nr:hypothetical protein [Desulfitibacter alkalitolerans]
MSHTLHRKGTAENLSQDFIVFSMTAKGFNEVGSKNALKEFLQILAKYQPVNMGDMKTGNEFIVSREEIINNVQDTSIVHGVFTDQETVSRILKELKEAELGVSVIVSGIIEETHRACQAAGIDRHTVEHSLGIRGKLSKLPEEEILEITTMCGHGMVSQHLTRQILLDIKQGKRSIAEAGQLLATPCVCGVFNPKRAEQLLGELVEMWCFDEY